MRFDPKISTREERVDLDSISIDELHGIFTTYQMRTERYKQSNFQNIQKVKEKGKEKRKRT
jgi:hypothetical protein